MFLRGIQTVRTVVGFGRGLGVVLLLGGLGGSLSGCDGVPAAFGPAPPPPPIYVQPTRYSIPSDVLFAFNSAALQPGATAALAQTLAQIRQAIPYPAIRVEGNTDSIGSPAYNVDLSVRRAQAVANWLIGQGIPPAAISVVGNGEARPVAPNTLPNGQDNPQGRALNRRVDLFARPA